MRNLWAVAGAKANDVISQRVRAKLAGVRTRASFMGSVRTAVAVQASSCRLNRNMTHNQGGARVAPACCRFTKPCLYPLHWREFLPSAIFEIENQPAHSAPLHGRLLNVATPSRCLVVMLKRCFIHFFYPTSAPVTCPDTPTSIPQSMLSLHGTLSLPTTAHLHCRFSTQHSLSHLRVPRRRRESTQKQNNNARPHTLSHHSVYPAS